MTIECSQPLKEKQQSIILKSPLRNKSISINKSSKAKNLLSQSLYKEKMKSKVKSKKHLHKSINLDSPNSTFFSFKENSLKIIPI
jgi:hypothetical protein